jgi:ankyrin repeat protein
MLTALLLLRHASQSGTTLLHTAAHNGHIECVRLLVARGADLDAKTKACCCPA